MPEPTPQPGPRVPFLTTEPLEDLAWGMALLPVWWFLGLEQLIWLPIGAFVFLKFVASREALPQLDTAGRLALVFLLAQLVSALFIAESFRLITFFRNWLTYAGAFLWFVLIRAELRTRDDLQKCLKGLGLGLAGAGLLGALGISGLWRPHFPSPLSPILPGGLASTTYGRQLAERNLGAPAWFFGLGDYFRVESVFTFATFFALALVVGIPIVLYLRRTARSRRIRFLWGAVAVLLGINMIYTTGRVSILSLILAGQLVFLWQRPRLLMLASLLVFSLGYLLVGTERGQRLVRTATFAAAYARGGGSVEGRGAVYRSTLVGIRERPFFGWGTERDLPGQKYPAGSHSYYLGMLYKHGIFGFASLVLFFGAIWTSIQRRAATHVDDSVAVQSARWIFLGLVLNGFTDVIDLDAIALVFAWVALAALTAPLPHSPTLQARAT